MNVAILESGFSARISEEMILFRKFPVQLSDETR